MRTADRRARRRLGWRFVTIFRSFIATMPSSRVCTSRPPFTLRYSWRRCVGAIGPVASTRTFSLRAQIARASASTSGAMINSTNWRSTIARAVAASSVRLNAMMPPNADVGSVRYALVIRRERVACDGDAARIRVLDDDAGSFAELPYALERSVAVRDVVVGQRLALQLLRAADAGAPRHRRLSRTRPSDADSRRSADRDVCGSSAPATPGTRQPRSCVTRPR